MFVKSTMLAGLAGGVAMALAGAAHAADYQIDPAHSFVEFKIQHLGYSWMYGRFNGVTGSFKYDADKPAESAAEVTVDTKTIDTNHAERDKHLRGGDFLDVDKFPKATFKSTGYTGDANGGKLAGVLTVHGVEKPVEIELKKVGEGPDPWGGYRAGFVGTYKMTRKDFGLDYELGPASTSLDLEIGLEGIKKK
ncbi:MAG: YceI family protein [Gammaproteobacteria bacterium]